MHKAADFVSPSFTSCTIMITPKFLLAVPVVLAFCTWKILNPPLEKVNRDKIDSLFEEQTKMKEQEATLMEEKKDLEDMTDDNNLQHEKKFTKVNSREELIFKPPLTAFSGSLSHDTVFFLVLIHTCGAGVVASISTVYHHMFSTYFLIEFALGGIWAVYTMYKCKREKEELLKKNALLQKQSLQKEREQEDVVTALMEVKAELENQRGQLKVLLEEVEGEKEENKQQLQSVEQEITEREMTFDKQEELLREKEKLLQGKWKLDEAKQQTERQLLNSKKLMEPIETLVTRIHRMKEKDVQN